ncbi:CRISPR-associated protein, Csm1 family [Hydrogenimonas sp.]|nr:CRISPR-associated protein, Csm1 family [Hydrogenimonas sp.]
MEKIDEIALAGLLHDIGKFGQRTDIYRLKDIFPVQRYRYTHAAYTAQILQDGGLAFKLPEEVIDMAAMHHAPDGDDAWIIAAADRMASGFEREAFEKYNEMSDREDFRKQRLWHLFDEKRRFPIAPLAPDTIYPVEKGADGNEYDALWKAFVEDMEKIEKAGSGANDYRTIDYLMKKHTSFIPSSTTFKKGDYTPVKANVPLYDHSRATAIFATAIYALYEKGDTDILDYYRHGRGDIERRNLLMVTGDFFGIQQFIFNDVPAAKASKILRSKSAYVQVLTRILALHVAEEIGMSHQSIVTTAAGKFEILAINTPETLEKVQKLQSEIDDFFIKEYFGETGVGLSCTPCALADFIVKGRYRESLRPRVAESVEEAKYRRFDLASRHPVLELDDGIDNRNLCQLCHLRKGIERESSDKTYIACGSCEKFVRIGRELATKKFLTISKGSGKIPIFGEWHLNFSEKPERFDNAVEIYDISKDPEFAGYAKWELASYVAIEDGYVSTFEELAQKSCNGDPDYGLKALAALKGDVDNMGCYIRNSDVTASFARYNFFSRMIDYFFSVESARLMEGRPMYTVFSGGDDIFILGAWDEVVEFSRELHEDFTRFAAKSGLTFSAGIVVTKPNKPVNFIAEAAESALEASKEYKEKKEMLLPSKDALTLFGETAGWKHYADEDNALYLLEELPRLEEMLGERNTSMLYRLLQLNQMRLEMDENIENSMWRSRLSYTFRRNLFEKYAKDAEKTREAESLMKLVANMIENYPMETKMVLSEYIYKRRRV